MISIPEEELIKIVDIDDYRLGAWKIEGHPEFGKYVRQKCYIDFISDERDLKKDEKPHYEVTCAGLSKSCIKYNEDKSKVFYKIFEEDEWKEFDIKDFNVGFTCGGKLSYKHVPGGVILVETTFMIKEKF